MQEVTASEAGICSCGKGRTIEATTKAKQGDAAYSSQVRLARQVRRLVETYGSYAEIVRGALAQGVDGRLVRLCTAGKGICLFLPG